MRKRRRKESFFFYDRSPVGNFFCNLLSILFMVFKVFFPYVLSIFFVWGTFQIPTVAALIVHNVILISWGIKMFWNYSKCSINKMDTDFFEYLHVLHTFLSWGSVFFLLIYTKKMNTFDSFWKTTGIIGSIAVLIVVAYYIRYQFYFQMKYVLYALIGVVLVTVVIKYDFYAINTLGARQVSQKNAYVVECNDTTTYNPRGGSIRSFHVVIQDENGKTESYDVEKEEQKRYSIGNQIEIPIYEGKFGIRWSSLDLPFKKW